MLFWCMRFVLWTSLLFAVASTFAPTFAQQSASIDFYEDGLPAVVPEGVVVKVLLPFDALKADTLIRKLIETGRYESVSVFSEGSHVRIETIALKTIRSLKINGLPSSLDSEQERLLRLKSGRPFNARDIQLAQEQLEVLLRERGYPNAIVTSHTEADKRFSKYTHVVFDVERGRPCRVSGLVIEPRLSVLSVVNPPVESGSICDIQNIKDSLERQKNNLMTEGHLQADFSYSSISYSPNKDSAVVYIRMLPGPRTSAVVVNDRTGSEDELLNSRNGFSYSDLNYLSDDDLRDLVYRDYQRRGYARSKVVGPNRTKQSNGGTRIEFRVDPGDIYYIEDIEFKGLVPVPKSEIISELPLEAGFASSRAYYVEPDLDKLRDSVRNFYIGQGFTDVEVSSPLVTSGSKSNYFLLTFQVEAGRRYVVSRIIVNGVPVDFKMDSDLKKQLQRRAFPLSPSSVQELLQNLRLDLIRKGYAYALTESAVEKFAVSNKNEEFVSLILNVKPGPPVRINRITAEGSTFEKDERLILESSLSKGDMYTPDNLERARQRILIHGLFSTVEVTPIDPTALDRRESEIDLVVRVRRRGDYSLGLMPGWSSLSGYRFSIDFAKNNLTDAGLRFFSSSTISQEKQQKTYANTGQLLGRRLSLGVTEPFFRIGPWVSAFDVSLSGSVGAEVQPLFNREFSSFALDGLWRPFFFDLSWLFNLRLVHERSKVLDVGLPPIEVLEQNSAIQIDEFVIGTSLDLRDNREWPTRGGFYETTGSFARFGIGSQVQYNRYTFDVSQFYSVWGRFSGALTFGGVFITNTVNELNDTAVAPGSRRANLTGRAQVRGFPERTVPLGPLIWLNLSSPDLNSSSTCDTTMQPTGATNLIYVKHEFRYRSPWFGNKLGFAWFIDSGSAFLSQEEENKISDSLAEIGTQNRSANSCKINDAKLIGNDIVSAKKKTAIKDYLQSNYVSSGMGVRFIIPNIASVNLDWGVPLRDPADGKDNCTNFVDATKGTQAPECINRRKSAFFLKTVPGALHLSIGAVF